MRTAKVYFALLGTLALVVVAAAQSITGGGGGGSSGPSSIAGGSCSANQYANAIGTDGAPTCAGVTSGQVSGLTSIATSGSATDLNTGTIPQARLGVAPTAWTPIDSSGAALTFSAASGSYVRMGNMIFAYAFIAYPSTVNGSNAIIGGLPVTSANQTYAGQCSLTTTSEATLAHVQVNQNNTTMQLFTTANANVTNATMSTDFLYIMCIYPVT
jgi:hypothetical protein